MWRKTVVNIHRVRGRTERERKTPHTTIWTQTDTYLHDCNGPEMIQSVIID